MYICVTCSTHKSTPIQQQCVDRFVDKRAHTASEILSRSNASRHVCRARERVIFHEPRGYCNSLGRVRDVQPPFCQCSVPSNLNRRVLCYLFALMATSQEEWTEEKCLELIREFRSRPVLWDQKHMHFYKKTIKPEAWEEIGQTLGMSSEAAKHKMIVLMSSFRREKSKIMHSIKGGGE